MSKAALWERQLPCSVLSSLQIVSTVNFPVITIADDGYAGCRRCPFSQNPPIWRLMKPEVLVTTGKFDKGDLSLRDELAALIGEPIAVINCAGVRLQPRIEFNNGLVCF
jgi:hypothetical protein